MKRNSYDTVTEAMTDLKVLGYTIDFSILMDKECLICHQTSTVLSPDNFEIDDFYKFEGDSDPGDGMIVYAVSSKDNTLKGIVVNAYGIYAENTSSAIVKKLNAHPEQEAGALIDNITHYLRNRNNKDTDSSPKGICPVCWGYHQYDGKIRTLLKDKQVDINNYKESYMVIQNFMKNNLDSITLKKGVVFDCPNCITKTTQHDY